MLEIQCKTFGSLQNNCYLITDKATGLSALVDCTEDSAKMNDYISGAKLEYILLTHGHYDHTGGVKAVSEKTGAKIVIGADDEIMLKSSKMSLAAYTRAPHEYVEADITVGDGDTITLGESVIKVMATPGHSMGSVCYICDDIIFSGDTLFFCSYGRTDFPGGSEPDMRVSLKRLSQLEGDYKVYPGHDRFSTLDFERKNNPYMRQL